MSTKIDTRVEVYETNSENDFFRVVRRNDSIRCANLTIGERIGFGGTVRAVVELTPSQAFQLASLLLECAELHKDGESVTEAEAIKEAFAQVLFVLMRDSITSEQVADAIDKLAPALLSPRDTRAAGHRAAVEAFIDSAVKAVKA